jgi:two-component system chemotaxis response regulator CheB
MIKVLVVEDSLVAKEYLIHILSSAPGVEIIGTAANGREALEAVSRLKPDVVTMDINMPVMDGLEATRRIMETTPVPIVIVSGNWNPKEVETTFRAIEAGALAIVQRPVGIGHPDAEKMAGEMVLKVRLMSEVKVVRRWDRNRAETSCGTPIQQPDTKLQRETAYPQIGTAGIDVVAIGASTGGPMAIKTILNSLPKDFPASILIVQHIAAGFLRGMVDWLTETSAISLRIAADGEVLLPGHAYFAPEGFNVGVRGDGRIYLDDKDANQRARPSASYLFRSVADVFGRNAAGILLSGMGRDGAEELKLMREKGQVTIAQDRESSVIYGMPGAAVELGAAMYVLSPDKIAAALNTLTRRKERGQGRL